MTLFAFDVTFASGKVVTLFFHDFRIETALLRAPVEAERQYGDRASTIVDISVSTRF